MRRKIQITIGQLLIAALMTAAAGAGGCSDHYTSGTDVKALDDPNFKIVKGHTTESELINHYGPPMSTTVNGDGTKVLAWSGSDAKTSGAGSVGFAAAGIVPFGLLVAHTDMNAQTTSISVTIRDGVVIDYNIINSNQNTHLY